MSVPDYGSDIVLKLDNAEFTTNTAATASPTCAARAQAIGGTLDSMESFANRFLDLVKPALLSLATVLAMTLGNPAHATDNGVFIRNNGSGFVLDVVGAHTNTSFGKMP
jgi:hypothetical protein